MRNRGAFRGDNGTAPDHWVQGSAPAQRSRLGPLGAGVTPALLDSEVVEFHIITLFPEMFESPFRAGMIGRAIDDGLIVMKAHPLREHGLGNYRQGDDAPH